MIENPQDLVLYLAQKKVSDDKLNVFFQSWLPSATFDEINFGAQLKGIFATFKLEPKSFMTKIIFNINDWHKYSYNLAPEENYVLNDITSINTLEDLKHKRKVTVGNFIQMSFINLLYVANNYSSYSSYSVGTSISQAINKIELLFNNIEPKHIQASFSTPFMLAGKEVFLADVLTTNIFKAKTHPYVCEDYEKIISILTKHNVNLLSTGIVQYLPNLLLVEQIKPLQIIASSNPDLELSPSLTLNRYFAYLHKNKYSTNEEFNMFLEQYLLTQSVPKAKIKKRNIKV